MDDYRNDAMICRCGRLALWQGTEEYDGDVYGVWACPDCGNVYEEFIKPGDIYSDDEEGEAE